jgi:protein SCO1/2
VALGVGLVAGAALAHDTGHEAAHQRRLPTIGAAPDFALTGQDGAPVTLADLRGKVLAVAFIYTSCPDVCPLLTTKMAEVQDALGADFGRRVAFVSITVDPARDTPEMLKDYAAAHGADPRGWAFLTGAADDIRAVARGFGVAVLPAQDGTVDHTTLTSLVDRHGLIRVQYLGYRFDPEEFRRDISGLLAEP